MYSNFITPPDFVNEDKHTVTIIDASLEEVEQLCKIAENGFEDYNLYLYRSEMNDLEWLHLAIKNSDSIIVNVDAYKNEEIFKRANVYYYGKDILISPAQKINSLLSYFQTRQDTK